MVSSGTASSWALGKLVAFLGAYHNLQSIEWFEKKVILICLPTPEFCFVWAGGGFHVSLFSLGKEQDSLWASVFKNLFI